MDRPFTDYSSEINLSVLKHRIGKITLADGETLQCIFLPIDANFFRTDKNNNIKLPIFCRVNEKEDAYGQTGFIAQRASSDHYKNADETLKAKFKDLPFLGNFYPLTRDGYPQNQLPEPSAIELNPGDDLPY